MDWARWIRVSHRVYTLELTRLPRCELSRAAPRSVSSTLFKSHPVLAYLACMPAVASSLVARATAGAMHALFDALFDTLDSLERRRRRGKMGRTSAGPGGLPCDASGQQGTLLGSSKALC